MGENTADVVLTGSFPQVRKPRFTIPPLDRFGHVIDPNAHIQPRSNIPLKPPADIAARTNIILDSNEPQVSLLVEAANNLSHKMPSPELIYDNNIPIISNSPERQKYIQLYVLLDELRIKLKAIIKKQQEQQQEKQPKDCLLAKESGGFVGDFFRITNPDGSSSDMSLFVQYNIPEKQNRPVGKLILSAGNEADLQKTIENLIKIL